MFEVCTCVSACRAELIGILLVKIGWLVKKLFLGYLSQEVSLVALLAGNLEIHLIFNYFPCQSESIDMLPVKIGETVKKNFKRGLFGEICSLAPLDWNFWKFRKFQFFPLGLLNRSVYYLWKSVERLKSYSRREFSKKMLPCSPKLKFWKTFESFSLFPLVCWIDRCITCENRWKGSKVIQ